MHFEVVVNTWPTKSTPWIVQEPAPPRSVLEKILEKVEELPVIVDVPASFSELSMPRYFLIRYRLNDNDVKIVEIVGIKRDRSPTKWGYKIGYWHPACQIFISRALRKYLSQ